MILNHLIPCKTVGTIINSFCSGQRLVGLLASHSCFLKEGDAGSYGCCLSLKLQQYFRCVVLCTSSSLVVEMV